MAKDKTASDVSKMIKDHDVKLVDFKFTDLPGSWQHFTTTLTEYNEEIFTDGLGFDGSSIRGWRVINASDMLVIPDPTTAWIDVFNAEPTLSLICTIVDPITREPYDRDPLRTDESDGRPPSVLQIHHPERGEEAQQDRYLHAQATLWRQRLRHAHPHVALERWQTAFCRERLCRAERNGALLHRRNLAARPRANLPY